MQKALSTKHPNGLADEINLQELFYVLNRNYSKKKGVIDLKKNFFCIFYFCEF